MNAIERGSAINQSSDAFDPAGLGRRLTLPVIGLVALAVVAVSGLVLWAAAKQDQIALDQETRFVAYEVEDAGSQLGRVAKDFTWYDLAIAKLFTRFDARFAEDTIGAYMARQHRVRTSVVLDRADKVVFMAVDGRGVDPERIAGFDGDLAALADTARAAPINEPIPVSGFVRFEGRAMLVVASAFTPAYNNGRVKPEDRGVLVLAQTLDQFAVPHLFDGRVVEDARFVPIEEGGPGVGVPVTGLDGALLGSFTWTPSEPGGSLVQRAILPLVVAALVIGALLALFLRGVRGTIARLAASARQIEAGAAELAAIERRQRAIFERVADGIVIADTAGRITACNAAAGRLFGFDAEHLAGRHADELLSRDGGSGDPATLLEDLVRDNAEGGALSMLARRRDGSHAVIEASAAPVEADGERMYALVLRDVTERHRAEETLDLLATGTIVVTAGARVLLANRSAERVLRRGDLLRVEGGRLRAAMPWHDEELQKLVGAALDPGVVEPMAGIGVMNLVARPETSPLHLIVSPLRLADDEGTPSAAIIVRDRDAQTNVHPAFLRRLYGLTRAEARVVAELAKGKRLQEVADGLHVSLNTVRNQLKQAFNKTQTNRQSDLVSLVLTSVADLNLDEPANEPGEADEPEAGRGAGG